MTRLGIGTYTYAWNIGHAGMTRPDLMRQAQAMGAGVVQFCENLELREEDLDEVLAFGIPVEIGTRGLLPSTLERAFGVAERVGSPFLRLVIDTPGDEPTPEEAVRRLEPFAGRDVRLAIENHDRFPAAVLADMVEALGAAVCLDTANSLGALEGTKEVVTTLAPYTVCLHVKDVRARRFPHQMGFVVEGTVAGQGSLDVPWILAELDRANASYSVILEQWPPVTDGPPVERERQMAEASWAYLQSL